MRVEDRTGVMKPKDDKTPNIICICEDEAESQIVDLLGNPEDKVTGELHLADGYGEFYVRLEPYTKPEAGKFTNEVRQFIIRKTAIEGIDNLEKFLSEYGAYMTQALDHLDTANALNEHFVTVIHEVIERMDEEPAKEILRKALI